jgi:phosphomannomutase
VGDLTSIVKAYDIRGIVPEQLDEGVAEALGAAFAATMAAFRDEVLGLVRAGLVHAGLVRPAATGGQASKDI